MQWKLIYIFSVIQLFFTFESPGFAKSYEQLTTSELVKLCARVVGANKLDKAKMILEEAKQRLPASIEQNSNVDEAADYYEITLLQGIVAVKEKNYVLAEKILSKAFNFGLMIKQNPRINPHESASLLIKAMYKNKKSATIVKLYEKHPSLRLASVTDKGLFFTISESLKDQKRYVDLVDLALNHLEQSMEIDIATHALKILYENELAELARKYAYSLILKRYTSEEQIELVAGVIYQKENLLSVSDFLQYALLLHPRFFDLKYKLASTFISQNKLVSAESVLRSLYFDGKEHNFELAEINLKLGNLDKAKFFNMQVKDSKKKIQQRLAIHLKLENFDSISALNVEIDRYGISQDDNFKYLVGYSHMMSGSYKKAKKILAKITSPSLITKTIELRKNLSECEKIDGVV